MKYYLRDGKEKMVIIPNIGAVNLQAARRLGLIAHDDIEEATHVSKLKRTSLTEYLEGRKQSGDAPQHEPASKRESTSLSEYLESRKLSGDEV
jgi:hypothetical protein